MGTSQEAAAKHGVSLLHRVVWTVSFLSLQFLQGPAGSLMIPAEAALINVCLRGHFLFLGLHSPVLPKLKASGQVVGDEERLPTVLAVVPCPRGAAPAMCPLQPLASAHTELVWVAGQAVSCWVARDF